MERQGFTFSLFFGPFWCVRHMRLFTKAQSKDRVRGDGGRDGFPPPAAVRLNGKSDEKRQGSLQVWVLRATGVQGLGLEREWELGAGMVWLMLGRCSGFQD